MSKDREPLYWVVKRDYCYLDVLGHNRFEQRKACRFVSAESAAAWAKAAPGHNRVVAIIPRTTQAKDVKR